jgi:hypothetical protein
MHVLSVWTRTNVKLLAGPLDAAERLFAYIKFPMAGSGFYTHSISNWPTASLTYPVLETYVAPGTPRF